MKRDEVFAQGPAPAAGFEFSKEVADVFDDMLLRSVPLYSEQQRMIQEISKAFWLPGTSIYDLGCSTATAMISLARELPDARFVGYDNSHPMIAQAGANLRENSLEDRVELRYADLNGSLGEMPLTNASIVIMSWTLQFVRPLNRDNLLRHIYDSLAENGVLIVADKVLTNSSPMNRFFIDFYYDYKRRNGYSELEISRKREALENVLIPYRIDENLVMFRRNGFEIAETFFQWYNFAGFLCVKRSDTSTGRGERPRGE